MPVENSYVLTQGLSFRNISDRVRCTPVKWQTMCIHPKGTVPLTLEEISLFSLYCEVLMEQRGIITTLWCAPGCSELLFPWFMLTLIFQQNHTCTKRVNFLDCVTSDSLQFIVLLKCVSTKRDRHLHSVTIPHSECLRTARKQTQRTPCSVMSNLSYRIAVLPKRGRVLLTRPVRK
jgi:hypothetical protein